MPFSLARVCIVISLMSTSIFCSYATYVYTDKQTSRTACHKLDALHWICRLAACSFVRSIRFAGSHAVATGIASKAERITHRSDNGMECHLLLRELGLLELQPLGLDHWIGSDHLPSPPAFSRCLIDSCRNSFYLTKPVPQQLNVTMKPL